MKTPARQLPFLAALTFFLSLTFAVFAQKPPEVSASPAASQPAPEAAPAAASAPAEPAEAPALRRLDAPAAADETAAPANDQDDSSDKPEEATSSDDGEKSDAAVAHVDAADAQSDATPAPAAPEKSRKTKHKSFSGHRHDGNERVSIWHDSSLSAGEYADAVVSIFGSSTSDGTVGDAVISILGSSTSTGDVGNAVVSVFGNTRVSGGKVGDAAVAVLGSNYVNTRVNGEVVAVLGDVELGPKADVGGDVVCVGGTVIRDPKAVVHGQVNNVALGAHLGGHLEGLHAWVAKCLLYGRPLAFSASVIWAWWLALGFLALYVVLALLFPRGIERCAETFEQRPGYSILTAFLVTFLAPLAAIVLIITILGAPALIIFLFLAGLFGKAVMLAWIGRRFSALTGDLKFGTALAVLVGGVIVLLLYTVPFVGFLVAKLLSWLGLGVVIYTLILGSKRNKAAARAAAVAAAVPATPPSTQPPVMPASVPPAATVETPGVAMDPAAAAATPPPLTTAVPATVPVAVPAATLLRAGFWIRVAAAALDAVLVAVAMHLIPHVVRPNFMLLVAAYSVVLWALKGTTVGGIVCGLKVVRLDDRPLDWATALVRALGGFLSFIVVGLGFIWVAFDDQKQSWHDKIAGTVVVHVPKGMSLV